MGHILNSGIKQHNLSIFLLENLGLKRLKIIFKQIFQIIRDSNPKQIPLFGSLWDTTMPTKPTAIGKLKIKPNEFSTINPIYSNIANISDIRQTFEVNSAVFSNSE